MREIRIILAVIIVAFLFALAFFILIGKEWDGKSVLTLLGPNEEKVQVRVEVADTALARTQGLQNRQDLAENSGMFFVFDYPQVVTFWMKDTYIPLDILFFDTNGFLVRSLSMEPCKQEQCPTYSSKQEASYALEVHAGFVETHKITQEWQFTMK